MRHLTKDPLPEGVYNDEEMAIIRYAQKSTRLKSIDDVTYGNLAEHFCKEQIIDICLTVGLSNLINRFHATFHTNVDAATLDEVAAGNTECGICPISLPAQPG